MLIDMAYSLLSILSIKAWISFAICLASITAAAICSIYSFSTWVRIVTSPPLPEISTSNVQSLLFSFGAKYQLEFPPPPIERLPHFPVYVLFLGAD